MIRTMLSGGAAAAMLFAAASAPAKPYIDYSPGAGVWDINAIDVDPNHIDDYLVGLKKSQVPAFESMKRHGIIDDYKFMVRDSYTKSNPSVLIMLHFTSYAMLAPDKVRDEMIDKEALQAQSEEEGKAAVAGYEKYRTFIDQGHYVEMKLGK